MRTCFTLSHKWATAFLAMFVFSSFLCFGRTEEILPFPDSTAIRKLEDSIRAGMETDERFRREEHYSMIHICEVFYNGNIAIDISTKANISAKFVHRTFDNNSIKAETLIIDSNGNYIATAYNGSLNYYHKKNAIDTRILQLIKEHNADFFVRITARGWPQYVFRDKGRYYALDKKDSTFEIVTESLKDYMNIPVIENDYRPASGSLGKSSPFTSLSKSD